MKYKHIRITNSSTSRGFTLVELMIAAFLGLLLIGSALQIFLGSNRSFTLQSELADIQEDGRFGLMFLENEVQKAGWFDDKFRFPPKAVDLTDITPTGRKANSDFMTISYQLEGAGADRDCNGGLVNNGLITNSFYLGGTDGEQLMCVGNSGGTPQAIIDGVKDFQVLYGIETDSNCPDGAVNQYMTREQVLSIGENNLLIASIRVAFLVSSGRNVVDVAETQTHNLLNKQVTTNDQLAYRVFQKTIYMPNAYYAVTGDPGLSLQCAASQFG